MKAMGRAIEGVAARPLAAVAVALVLAGGLAFGLGRDGVVSAAPVHRTAEVKDCPPERRVGGREIEIVASEIADRPLDPRRLDLRQGEYVLTFDDGPTWVTDQILDTLDFFCAKATFFMIGKRAEERPKTVLRALRDGHGLANHTYAHVDLTQLPLAEASAQISRGREAIAATSEGAAAAILMRPPAWRMNADVRQEAIRLGALEIGPDISPKDWKGDAPDRTLDRLGAELERRDRGVILLHDNQPNTRRVLKSMLAEFARTGRKVVSVRVRP